MSSAAAKLDMQEMQVLREHRHHLLDGNRAKAVAIRRAAQQDARDQNGECHLLELLVEQRDAHILTGKVAPV